METTVLYWELGTNETRHRVERHCATCGRKTDFVDTGKRRHNANGKNIFEYGIYKCEKGHTWNHFIRTYKAVREEVASETAAALGSMPEQFALADYQGWGVRFLEIRVGKVSGKWRLDKLLAQQIADHSRAQIVKWIENGVVRVDGAVVNPDVIVKPGWRILIQIEFLN